jgi:type I restriction enzyme S subunit
MTMTTQTMPKGWTITTLGEVAQINPSESLSKGEIAKYVPMESIAPFTRRISKYESKEFNGGMKFRNGDTLLARITPCLENGKTSFVDILENEEVGFGSTEYIVIREKKDSSDKLFLYYLSISPRFRETAIKAMTGTSGRQRVQTDLLVSSALLVPSLSEQRAIAAVLSALDDKIELLRKNNKTLENIAQTLFKRWFVDYEFPNEKGKPYKSSGGKMIDSDLGKIPAGWRVGSIGDIVNIYDSQRIPLASDERALRKGNYPYYGAAAIMDYVDDYLFDGIYLLLAEDGSVMDDKGYPVLQYAWGKMWVNNHAHVLQGKNGFSTEMLYLLFRKTKIAGIVNGAVQLKINQGNLLGLEIVRPEQNALNLFCEVISPVFAKIRSSHNQIQTLSHLRDSLLPKLMNGELRVKGLNGKKYV